MGINNWDPYSKRCIQRHRSKVELARASRKNLILPLNIYYLATYNMVLQSRWPFTKHLQEKMPLPFVQDTTLNRRETIDKLIFDALLDTLFLSKKYFLLWAWCANYRSKNNSTHETWTNCQKHQTKHVISVCLKYIYAHILV